MCMYARWYNPASTWQENKITYIYVGSLCEQNDVVLYFGMLHCHARRRQENTLTQKAHIQWIYACMFDDILGHETACVVIQIVEGICCSAGHHHRDCHGNGHGHGHCHVPVHTVACHAPNRPTYAHAHSQRSKPKDTPLYAYVCIHNARYTDKNYPKTARIHTHIHTTKSARIHGSKVFCTRTYAQTSEAENLGLNDTSALGTYRLPIRLLNRLGMQLVEIYVDGAQVAWMYAQLRDLRLELCRRGLWRTTVKNWYVYDAYHACRYNMLAFECEYQPTGDILRTWSGANRYPDTNLVDVVYMASWVTKCEGFLTA